MDSHYEWADSVINESPSFANGFTMQLAAGPYWLTDTQWQGYARRHQLIREFQSVSLAIFRTALQPADGLSQPADEKWQPALELSQAARTQLREWLLNDTPISIGYDYHRSLEDRHWTLPQFFRTDEAEIGQIIEIQCPGSLWGELQLTYDYCVKTGQKTDIPSPAAQFAEQLTQLLQQQPIVHHFTDHATSPGGTRYFTQKTRPDIQYWGIDRGIRPEQCNFIRGNQLLCIFADDLHLSRMQRAGHGLAYDYPPHILFEQKAPLVLPFWSFTRRYFSDEIRELFAYSIPLLPDGLELPDGERLKIEEFASLPRSCRAYYLKYAGPDGARSYGGRAVFRLSNLNQADCLALLQACLAEYPVRGVWLLQEALSHDDDITCIRREQPAQTQRLRAKFSGFYGPFGFLGGLAMHGQHYKVHGQPETVISCMLPAMPSQEP